MSDSEASGERSPMDLQPASNDGQPPLDEESPGDQPSQSPASPGAGGGSPKTTSSSGLTTPHSISLALELSLTSGETSTSKSGDKSREASPASQRSVSPRSPDSKRLRRSSVGFAKEPIIHPIPARSRSAPVSPPGGLTAVKSAVENISTKVKKLIKGKTQAPPVNTWMKEVKTKRYRCVCGRLYNWGESASGSVAGPSSAAPVGKCDNCDTPAPVSRPRSPSGTAPLADTEDLTDSEDDELDNQQSHISIVVHPPTDEPMPEEPPPEEHLPEEPQPDESSSEVPSPEQAPELPSDEEA